MRVSRIYQSIPLKLGHTIELDGQGRHYFRTVLRLKKGSNVIVFNGEGGEYLGHILESSRKRVVIDIQEWIDKDLESNLKVNFGLSISKGSRMDFAIQKAVELGVNVISPLISERTVVKFTEHNTPQKLNHWQKIAIHAAEQCGRTIVPAVNEVVSMTAWLGQQSGTSLFLDPNSTKKMTSIKIEQQNITLLAGPEGGFSMQERELITSSGFIPIQLGLRILRSETAAIAALAAAQTLWGDYG